MSKTLELIELAHGLLRDLPDCRLWGVDDGALVLAWIDATPGQNLMAVMKVTPGTMVLMPWQDARACRRKFVPGFDD